MTEITKKEIEEFKQIYKKEYNQEISDEEAYDASHRLTQFSKILFDQMIINNQWEQRLEKEPNGFHFDDDGFYTCCICHESIRNKEIWYDQNGIKCIPCQKALDTKVIPKYICTKPDSWLSDWKVQNILEIHSATMRKMIRDGELKPRIINREDGSKNFELFIIKENKILSNNNQKTTPVDK